MIDEKQLVMAILDGKEIALRKFYRYYSPRLLTFIRRKIENGNDAEEILQDSLLATLEGLRDFSFRSSLLTFTCAITMHKIIDFYRKKKLKNIVFSKIKDMEPLVSTLVGPENALDEELVKQKIKTVFGKLTPTYRLILELKYVQGYTVTEIANKLSISFKSAESQLFRARKAFVAIYSL
jgi:RNA polymerase sigma-70 factor (ECF subfamily)